MASVLHQVQLEAGIESTRPHLVRLCKAGASHPRTGRRTAWRSTNMSSVAMLHLEELHARCEDWPAARSALEESLRIARESGATFNLKARMLAALTRAWLEFVASMSQGPPVASADPACKHQTKRRSRRVQVAGREPSDGLVDERLVNRSDLARRSRLGWRSPAAFQSASRTSPSSLSAST